MISRRSFLEILGAGSATLALTPSSVFSGIQSKTSSYFRVHPFVDSHPNAVFIMRTNVDVKTNSVAVKQAGLTFGQSVFVPSDSPGVPVSHRVAIKPNIVMMPAKDVDHMGIVTDPYFVEGIIESLKLVGLSASQFYLREVNDPGQFENSGYAQMAQRTGADLRKLDDPIGVIAEEEIQWVDVPSGQWFTRIPYLWPVNAPDTWLLNIAKFKSHLMGMSLCAKNIQGAIAIPYVEHCKAYSEDMLIPANHVRSGAKAQILDSYNRHRSAGIPRWDRPGEEGGIWQETWSARCMDNNSVTHAGLNIIEAVYGREGAFVAGPGVDGEGIDHLTNMIIFGKNPFHVDSIGVWLSGHEPGNFGYLHIAKERGFSSILNPADIPVYEWKADGSAVPAPLSSFTRFSLRTNYLRRDYNGQQETEWHLVNEPYVYSATEVAESKTEVPRSFVLRNNYPNPFNSSTSIQVEIPRDGHVRVEVLDIGGQTVDLLVDEHRIAGAHLLRWDARRRASGVYFCRASYAGRSDVRSMMLLR
jgi:hypothetical protein